MTRIRSIRRDSFAALILVACATNGLVAQEKAIVAPQAEKVLRAMARFYAAAPAISLRIEDEKRTPPVEAVHVHRDFIGRSPEVVYRDLLRADLTEFFAGRRPAKP